MATTTIDNNKNTVINRFLNWCWGFFCPIYSYELKKFIPMFLLSFLISLNYCLLRGIKDSLVVPTISAKAIPFLKVGGVVPCAILFMIAYSWLSNKVNKEKLFYCTIAPFLAFFLLYGLVLYPNLDSLHFTGLSKLVPFFDIKFLNFINTLFAYIFLIIENWTSALFYVIAELWGSAALSLLFWGFANQITKVTESKRFYVLFGLGANIALVASKPIFKFQAKFSDYQSMLFLMIITSVSAALIIAIYYWMNRYVLTDARLYDPNAAKKPKKKKEKMSLMDSFKFLAKSKYLSYIAILVFAYGISIVLIEVVWKDQVGQIFTTKVAYREFMGDYNLFLGLTTIFMMLCVSGQVLRKFGWGTAASFTPVVLAITGILFFIFTIFNQYFAQLFGTSAGTFTFIALVIGSIQNIMSKATKYSLFDPTKEMTYIPLDDEMKVKGKAAIDVVGARMGKAGGSLINIVLIALFGSISAITPIVAAILLFVVGSWLYSISKLSLEFKKATDENENNNETTTVKA